jgi:hypothetical protein
MSGDAVAKSVTGRGKVAVHLTPARGSPGVILTSGRVLGLPALPAYQRREPSEAADYMRSVGLEGAFWGL